MTHIYMIRHAEAEGNVFRRIHGWCDSDVTPRGMRQIKCLEKRFENIHIDAVYSSDLTRPRKTAMAICGPRNTMPILDPRLREIKLGVWEDTLWGNAAKFEYEQYLKFNRQEESFCIEGAETYPHLRKRIVEAVTDIASRNDGRDIAVVTHGTALWVFLSAIAEGTEEELKWMKTLENTSVTELTFENGKFGIVKPGDSDHLTPDCMRRIKLSWGTTADCIDHNDMYAVSARIDRDGELIAKWHEDTWRCAHGSLKGYDRETYMALTARRISAMDGAVSILYHGEDPAGIVELDVERAREKGVGWISFYCMDEKFRGKALSPQLLGQCVAVYRALGRDRLGLCVAEENTNAIGYYKHYGFEQTSECEGALGKLLIMERKIKS